MKKSVLVIPLLCFLPFCSSASWTNIPLPNLTWAWGATALDHLPDGRFVFAQCGHFVLQDAFGATELSAFADAPPATDPSFIAVWSSNKAAAGRGGWGASDIDLFNPSQPAGAAFTNVGVFVGNYHGVFRDASGLYIGGAPDWSSPHELRYVSLDGQTNVSLIANISTYSCGFARDASGNLFVGDNDDGRVYKFTPGQLSGAITGAPLAITDGEFIHDFGGGGNIGTLAVDGYGRLWASGWQHNGLLAFNPLIQREFRYVPHLDNSDYKVVTFSATGRHFIAFMNQTAPYMNDSAQTYGYDEAGHYATYAPYGGPYAPDNGGMVHSNPLIQAWISGVLFYTNPVNGSGGYARNDAGGATNPAGAVIGKPASFTDPARHVLSLGNSGVVTVVFSHEIANGPGPDFVVFENAFTDLSNWDDTSREGSTNRYTFAELAFVEVATTTNHWLRFPVFNRNTNQVYAWTDVASNRFGSFDVTQTDGVAGKHIMTHGTPFDLGMLAEEPEAIAGLVNLDCIRYIRLVDITGNGSETDQHGNPIYDPYYATHGAALAAPPPSPTDGFDLRAIGVIHAAPARAALALNDGNAGLSFFAAHDAVYQVQAADALFGAWTDLGGAVTGAHESISLPAPSLEAGQQYYRIIRMNP